MNTETTVDSDSQIVDSGNQIEVDAVRATSEPTDNPTQAAAETVNTEEFRIQGDELVTKVKTLIHEGNIRRIILKNEAGHILIEIPLTVGVVGGVLSAALFPVLAAVGAIGAVVAHLTLVIEKRE
ncbi:MAG: DUF4342 domain-containing protein [Leptolyngbyaceae cyanobacterium SU_3_3]|nr:DUF4342 domain-containing protein [Leptolyngbyaceae cyanobacterium SU_3_3]NJR49445.1 DUF4342 domain-containing protein [Leptolyngbyaceae cyanobacterium CSU_1_3]